MFRPLIFALALLTGCAAGNTHVDDQPVTPIYDGEGLNYATTRPVEAAEGAITVDLTLVELDVPLAESVLGIGEPSDIAPRSFRKPMGEIAAVNAAYGHGRVIDRPTFVMPDNLEMRLEYRGEVIYLRYWADAPENPSPVFDTYREGVDGKLKLFHVDGGINVVLDATSVHAAWPQAAFEVSIGDDRFVKIEVPELFVVQRVATETVAPGETAMFQLSRAPFGDGTRIRLLFVRLRGIE